MRYLNLTVTGEDSVSTLAHLVHAIHGFNASRSANDRLAIAFPFAQEAVFNAQGRALYNPTPGNQLRIFGEDALIEEFVVSPVPKRMLKLGMALKGAISDVPAYAGAVRFVRDRQFERTHKNGAYARREVRRAQELGIEYTPRRQTAPRTFGLALRSKSTGHEFHIDVRKEPATSSATLENITAYGLCGPGSAVPLF